MDGGERGLEGCAAERDRVQQSTMKYIDSGLRDRTETVAHWMAGLVADDVQAFRCQAGYFTIEGASILLPTLKRLSQNGSTIQLLLGANGGATLASHISYLAGALALPQQNISLSVVAFSGSLFHPKVYHFERNDGSQTAYVGSANLTGPAISGQNVEAGVLLDTHDGDDAHILNDIKLRIEAWFNGNSDGASRVASATDIQQLLDEGVLSLARAGPTGQSQEEGEAGTRIRSASRHRLGRLFGLPSLDAFEDSSTALTSGNRQVLRHTEASFHYPQGTHLGHLLGILFYFSGDRRGTPYDDEYIRLSGSLGGGRLAALRRQIKYKLLAAIELGLIEDVRLVEDVSTYEPRMTRRGQQLWELLAPFVLSDDVRLERSVDGEFSTKTPRAASYYVDLVRAAQDQSEELRTLYRSIFLNMPATKQMLAFLYHIERAPTVAKSKIYANFFQSPRVVQFCDAMGIEPATHESAKHRCPLLINILESCGIVHQETTNVTVDVLALSPDLVVSEDDSTSDRNAILTAVRSSWGREPPTVSAAVLRSLRNLFGDTFLSGRYYLQHLEEIPS